MDDKDLEKLEGNKKYIIIGIIALIVIGLFFIIRMKNRVEVRVVNPEIGDISKNIYSDASLKSDEEARIYSQVKGEIKVVNHTIGDLVNKGDVLYELDKEAIEEEIKELDIYLKKEEKNTEKMKNNITVEEVELKSGEVDALEMELEELKEKEASSKLKYEEEEITLEEYQRVLEDKIKKESEFSQAKRDFQVANRALIQNLNMESMGKLKELTLKKKNLEELLKNHTIKASVSGVVLEQLVEKGEYIKSKDYLMKIGKIENIYLETIVPNEFADVLEKDMEVVIVVDKSGVKIEESKEDLEKDKEGEELKVKETSSKDDGDEGKINLKGLIGHVDIDDLKLELKEEGAVKIKVYNMDLIDEIRQGMTYKVGIEVDKRENTLLLDENVLVDKNLVYVVENNKLVKREVEIGLVDGRGLVEILSGLDREDNVVQSGSEKISEGTRVKIVN